MDLQKWHWRVSAILCCLLAVLLAIRYTSFLSSANERLCINSSLTGDYFSWEKLSPSKELKWMDCYTGRQCARLIVPLNHSDPEGRKAAIALIRKPAAVPATSPLYRGPILFNPGGPGGSGVDFVRDRGDLLSAIVGSSFDVVSFDPRGVSRSTPRASFFKTDTDRSLFGIELGLSFVNNSLEGVARSWARAQVVGKLAAETDDGYLRHINTDQTARDMLRIVEAHGRSKIQYWGFSYGSVLGATFAAMFPDKIERLIVDGVIDAENYYDVLWTKNLLDVDEAMDSFFRGCHSAGPDKCDFWAPSANDIRKKLTNIYDNLKSRPIPVNTKKGYGLVDYAMVRELVFRSLYSPYASFKPLASALEAISAGNGSLAFDMAFIPPNKCSCDPPDGSSHNVADAQNALVCNDGVDVPEDLASFEEYFESLSRDTVWSEIWASVRLSCVGWPKFPKDHFQGPFVANTSHPILFVGNTADPVTPLWAAKKMSEGFEGSVVLTQNSVGHCTISGPSLCTQKHIREYLVSGTLPKSGTVCEAIGTPFSPPTEIPYEDYSGQKVLDSKVPVQSDLQGTDKEILDAAIEFSQVYF